MIAPAVVLLCAAAVAPGTVDVLVLDVAPAAPASGDGAPAPGDGTLGRALATRAAAALAEATTLVVATGGDVCVDVACIRAAAADAGARFVLVGRLARGRSSAAVRFELARADGARVADAVLRAPSTAELDARLPGVVEELVDEAKLPRRPGGARAAATAPFRWGLLVGGAGVLVGGALLGAGIVSGALLAGEEADLRAAGDDYRADPSPARAAAVIDAHDAVVGQRTLHSWVLLPLACAAVPTCGACGVFLIGDLGAMARDAALEDE